ncbi:MAG: hypothetical protein MZV63_35005 [Marinilabiliales bacterium]|nr:hypothetical protein [Marinilabiliales bacterium]
MEHARAADRVRARQPRLVVATGKEKATASITVSAKDRELQPAAARDAEKARAVTMAEARHLQTPTMTVYAITLQRHQRNN